jgi:GxxExxY protein
MHIDRSGREAEAGMFQRGGAEDAEDYNALSEGVIGAAVEVHRHLGPGLLESAYEQCLCRELTLRQIRFHRQVPIDVEYKGTLLRGAFRVDLLVEDLILVELKAIEALQEIHHAQLLTYLRLTHRPLGLIINFHTPVLWKGVRRVVNRL